MRVISGTARGHRLKRVPGETTRPITDRVKENLFNILGGWVAGTTWLDLFAGTGQVGIEALSRGAERAYFVDNARPAIKTIIDNLHHTKLSEKAIVVHRDALQFLQSELQVPVDVIYVAPPQYRGIWLDILTVVDQKGNQFLAPGGLVIVQIDPKEYQEKFLRYLVLQEKRKYGNTMLCFYGDGD